MAKDASEKLHQLSKKKLKAEAERCGVSISSWWSKDKIIKTLLATQPIARKTANLSVEALANGDFEPIEVIPEKKPGKRIKFVDVKWLGVDRKINHDPDSGHSIRFERGKWTNLRLEIWRSLPKGDPNVQKKADILFHKWSAHYLEESRKPVKFWNARIRYGPLTTELVDKGEAWTENCMGLLDDPGAEVLLALRGVQKADTDMLTPYGNDKAHILEMLYQMEIEGKHRQTVMDMIRDIIDEMQGREPRNRRLKL